MAARAKEIIEELVERRSEPRHEGIVSLATLLFRGASYDAPVVNISSRGTMIESDIEPRLGESVIIRFAGCSPIHAFVRWARDGRIGLNFGCELTIG
jgi:PilZ domain